MKFFVKSLDGQKPWFSRITGTDPVMQDSVDFFPTLTDGIYYAFDLDEGFYETNPISPGVRNFMQVDGDFKVEASIHKVIAHVMAIRPYVPALP